MYENNVSNVAGNVANPVKPELGAYGAFCAAGQLRCTAPEYAIVNYINRDVTSKFTIGFRSDLLNDKKGQRTGIAGEYTDNTFISPDTSGPRLCSVLNLASITRGIPSSPWQNYGKCSSGDEACGTGKRVPSAGESGDWVAG
jgi:hypothetical protein